MKKAKGATIVTVGKESLKRHTNLWIFLAIALPLVVIGGAIGLIYGLGVFTPTYTIEVTQPETGGSITSNLTENQITGGTDVTYTVTPDLGYEIEEIIIDEGTEDEVVVEPTVDPGDSQEYTFTNVTENHTITATFRIRTFGITLDSTEVGGTIDPSLVEDIEYGDDQDFTITPNTGYKITAIEIDGIAQSLPAEGTATTITIENITENKTLVVVFAKRAFTITFDSNEGSAVAAITQDFATAVTAPTAPTRQATAEFTYSFAGWYTDDETFNNQYTFNTMPAGNITVYAKWTSTTNQYTVTFNYGDGETSDSTVDYNTAATVPSDLSKTQTAQYSYTFDHWSLTEDGEEYTGSLTNVTANVELYAVYTSTVRTYTVTFMNNGVVYDTQTIDYGSSATEPETDPTYEGHTFTGWLGTWTNIQENEIVIANYDTNVYTVTFKNYDNTTLEEQQVAYGDSATAPAEPTKPADLQYTYRFDAWDVDFSNVTGDLTVTAQFTPATEISYTVTFENPDTDILAFDHVTYDQIATYWGATPTQASTAQYDYTFTGWAINGVGIDLSTYHVVADVTITAVYSETLRSYDVTFYDHDGTTIIQVNGADTQIIDYDSSATVPADPTSYEVYDEISDETTIYIFGYWAVGGVEVEDVSVYAIQGTTNFVAYYYVDGVEGTNYMVSGDGEYLYTGEDSPTTLTIPSEVGGITVTQVDGGSIPESVTSLTLPNTLTSFTSSDIAGLDNLESITIDNSTYGSSDGAVYEKDGEGNNSTLVVVPAAKTELTLDPATDSIAAGVLDNTNVSTITVPSGTTLTTGYTLTESTIGSWTDESSTPITTLESNLSGDDQTYTYMYTDGSGTATGGWTYTVTGGDCYITGVPAGSGTLTIPATITVSGESMNVYGLENYYDIDTALTNVLNYSNVIINGGISNIRSCAFYGCTGLTSITIPESVTSIGDWAFANCSGLTSINIPNSVTSIGNYAFKTCSNLTSITIPDSVTSIGNGVFINCSSLESIIIPENITDINDYNFSGCTGLTSITIPNSVTSIGNSVFTNCSGLESITIPNSVTSIGDYAFEGCIGLTSIAIPNNVNYIGHWAFMDCSNLSNITIGDWISNTSLDYRFANTFTGSTTLNINILDNVTSIGDYAFILCAGLTSITIPEGVTSIGSHAFDSSGLTSIEIPDSVTSIGAAAFIGCSGLTSITIECSVGIIPYLVSMLSFSGITSTTGFIYVQSALVDDYKADQSWIDSGLTDRIFAIII